MNEKVCVVGLGYVGLPLAALCANKGFEVIGLDKKQHVVEKTNKGICYIKDEKIQEYLDNTKGNLKATTNPDDIKECKIYLIAVPTPVDENKEPDLIPIEESSQTVSKYLKKGDLVVVESTIFPGTCEEIVVPILEKSGLKAGIDFYLAHCPERVNPGDTFWVTGNIPRVVGALTKEGTKNAAEFYQKILGGKIYDVRDIKNYLRPKIIPEKDGYRINTLPLGSITKMNSIRDAEAVKAMENTVRDVNIAFVNELAKISEVLNLDVVDIIDGMTTKPFGKGPFYPGIGVGGHCIAVDPEWLKSASIKAGFFPKIIQIARDTNNSMPKYAIELIEKIDESYFQTKIAILGVSYKGNIDDSRESPFYDVKRILQNKGVSFDIFDPYYTKENTVNSIFEALCGSKVVILVTDHDFFKEEISADLLKSKGIELIIDGRNCLDSESIVIQGVTYRGIGKRI
ncbi:MAG: nucleotide sugar dehydrogenase [Alphaproteobacteria bacterium]